MGYEASHEEKNHGHVSILPELVLNPDQHGRKNYVEAEYISVDTL